MWYNSNAGEEYLPHRVRILFLDTDAHSGNNKIEKNGLLKKPRLARGFLLSANQEKGMRKMRRPARKHEVVAVKVDEGLVKAIDELAARMYRSRSDIIRQGVLKELEANGLCPVAA